MEYFNVARAEIYGVISFYPQLRITEPGKYIIKLCYGTACFVKGAPIINDKIYDKYHIKPGDTDAEKPAYFASAVTDIRCDPDRDGYCPTASEVSAGSAPCPKPNIRIIEVKTETTSCDAATGCSRSTIPAATVSPSTTPAIAQ